MKINEIFHSIQGEGILMGVPSVFVRLSGCNLRCQWCDTMYAYGEGTEMTLEEVIAKVREHPTSQVCLTGGEPLLQDDALTLVQALSDMGYTVLLETNGSQSIEELPCLDSLVISMDIKCPSSGMQGDMDFSNLEILGPNDQLKFIVGDEGDYEYAKGIIARYKPICNIIMTPVGGIELKALAEWVLKDGLCVRVLPQLHKMIWGERRGV